MKKCVNCFCSKDNYVPKQKGNEKLILIGEAPGEEEVINKRPFVGRSGQLLRSFLNKANINDLEVNITNAVKCRPYNNRTPTTEEICECVNNNLVDEINDLLNSKNGSFIIVGVGRIGSYAISEILKVDNVKKGFLSSCFVIKEISEKVKIVFLPHPSYLLRVRNEELDKKTQEVFYLIKEELIKLKE